MVGSYGAMTLAKTAISTNGTSMASGSTGNSPSVLTHPRRPSRNRGRATASEEAPVSSIVAMAHLFDQPDARIDPGIEKVDQQVDQDDHDPRLHHDPLHQRKIALEYPLVEKPADAGPSKDHLDDDCGVDHHDEVDAGQCQYRDQRVFEGVNRNDDVARQSLQSGELDVFAAQHLEHARPRQPQQRGGKIPAKRDRRHDQMAPAALAAGRKPAE